MSMLNENEDVDIMTWWKRNARGYPTLTMMARDVFTVPVSTVPFESCFSSANKILSDKRSKLGAHVFERLVWLKDWIYAEERKCCLNKLFNVSKFFGRITTHNFV
jgi:hAT family C-terminal dimerisation region